MEVSTLVERFAALFRGLGRAHGTYKVSGVITEKGKRDGKGTTLHEAVTLDHYARHLRGEYMLGIVPIMDDNTCVFCALDVDDYTGKYVPIVERIRDANLPLVPVLSKSGGIHLYLFFSEPVPCEAARAKLRELSEFLGIPGVECFPKQDVLAGKDEVGNWLNLCYFRGALGAQHSERLMVDPRTQEKIADLGRFLDTAERMRITAAELDALTIEARQRVKAPFSDGPPCLQKLAQSHVVGEGGRNLALYQFATYFREKNKNQPRYGDTTLAALVVQADREYMDPPLGFQEATAVAKSVYRDRGFYKCDDEPMRGVCNRALCLRRKYGIGDPSTSADQRLDFGGLIRYEIRNAGADSTQEQPWYDFTINGRNIRFSNEELYDVNLFRSRCADVLSVFPPPMKAGDWTKFLNSCFATQQIVAVPFESGPKGQLVGHVRDFARDYGRRDEWDALLEGGVYLDRKEMRAYFRWQDLLGYLSRKQVRGHQQRQVFAVLQQYMDARNGVRTISAKHITYWCVAIQQTDLPPPEEVLSQY